MISIAGKLSFLVSIASAEQQIFLESRIADAWIGLRYDLTYGLLNWDDGSNVTFRA